MSPRRAAAADDHPLPLECAGCARDWPDQCRCPHPGTCRGCGKPLRKPYAVTAGYCTLSCFLQQPATE